MEEYILLLFLALCSAKTLIGPSDFTSKNMMLQDMEDDYDDDNDDDSLFPTTEPIIPLMPFDLFPTCPFGCQCYVRVVHCSDLGKNEFYHCCSSLASPWRTCLLNNGFYSSINGIHSHIPLLAIFKAADVFSFRLGNPICVQH